MGSPTTPKAPDRAAGQQLLRAVPGRAARTKTRTLVIVGQAVQLGFGQATGLLRRDSGCCCGAAYKFTLTTADGKKVGTANEPLPAGAQELGYSPI